MPTGRQSASHPAFATPRLFHPERTLFSLFLLDVAARILLIARSWTASDSSFYIIEMTPQSPARRSSVLRSYSPALLSYHHIIQSPLSHAIQLLCCLLHTLLSRLLFFFLLFNITPHIHPPHAPFSGLIISPFSLSLAFSPPHVSSPTAAAHSSSFPIFLSRSTAPRLDSRFHRTIHLICPLFPHLVCSFCSKGADRRGRAGRERAPRRGLKDGIGGEEVGPSVSGWLERRVCGREYVARRSGCSVVS